MPAPSLEQLCRQLEQAQEAYFRRGIVTVQDGLTRQNEWRLLTHMAEQGRLRADVVAYPDMQRCPAGRQALSGRLPSGADRLDVRSL